MLNSYKNLGSSDNWYGRCSKCHILLEHPDGKFPYACKPKTKKIKKSHCSVSTATTSSSCFSSTSSSCSSIYNPSYCAKTSSYSSYPLSDKNTVSYDFESSGSFEDDFDILNSQSSKYPVMDVSSCSGSRLIVKCPSCNDKISLNHKSSKSSRIELKIQLIKANEKLALMTNTLADLERRMGIIEFSPPIEGGPEFKKTINEAKDAGDF